MRIVKEQLGMRTLAIGDGANDVSMIQTADVGVGISGHEGTQAVMAADFAVSRFSMLSRLLLLHGHWCYDRLARMILYFFYKNATFVFLVFWFQVRYIYAYLIFNLSACPHTLLRKYKSLIIIHICICICR